MTLRSSLALAPLTLLLLASACSPPPKPPVKPPPAPVAKPKGIGSACSPTDACPAGLGCAPFPGGSCVAPCGVGMTMCPGGSACVETTQAGELCLDLCGSNADCRTGEGYVCDASWQGCVAPGLAAIRAPQCPNVPDPPRKTFGSPQQITSSKGPGTHHVEPTAALDARGTLGILFIAGAPLFQPNTLGTTAIKANGTIEPEIELRGEKQNHLDPRTVADRKGKLHAVWLAHDGGATAQRGAIQYATSVDGKTWTQPHPIHDVADCPNEAPGCLDRPMIAIGPDATRRGKDAIWAFYFSRPSGGLRVVKSIDGGLTFGKSSPVGGGGSGDVDVASDGTIRVVTVNADPRVSPYGRVGNTVELFQSVDGGATFLPPVVLSDAAESIPLYFANPQIAYDVARKALYVAYPVGTPDGKWDLWLAATKDGGATTRVRVNDDAPCANHMLPALVVDPRTGKVHLMWNEQRGSIGRVVYASCAPGGAMCGPNEAVSDVPFGSYSFGRHTTKWQGEYNALVLDARRRTLHAVWTQTVDEGFGPVGRLFQASARLR